MCSELKFNSIFGYKHTHVNFTSKQSYVWHSECPENETDYIRFILATPKREYGTISGLSLHLSDYLSTALNKSMNFVELVMQETVRKIVVFKLYVSETTNVNSESF